MNFDIFRKTDNNLLEIGNFYITVEVDEDKDDARKIYNILIDSHAVFSYRLYFITKKVKFNVKCYNEDFIDEIYKKIYDCFIEYKIKGEITFHR